MLIENQLIHPAPAQREFIPRYCSLVLSKVSLRFAAGALSGVLMFACFPPLNWNWLVWVACVPLLAALGSERHLARAFGLAYLGGAIFLAGTCYWFTGVLERYGKLSAPLAVGVWVLFTTVFAVFFGAFGLAQAWVARRSVSRALVLSPFLWVAMEIARTYLITGFPWNLLGYAVSASGLRQLASVTAVYGLSFLAVTTSAWVVAMLLNPRQRRLGAVLALWIGLLVAADLALAPPASPAGNFAALLVQPDVPLDESALESWVPWRDSAPLARLVSLTLADLKPLARSSAAPPLVVWAENPAPFYFTRDPHFRAAMENMARQGHAYVVLNTVTFAGPHDERPQNSAIVLDPEGRVLLQYAKMHLVPFGEYVPGWAFPGKVGKITAEVGEYAPGSRYQVAGTPEGKIAVFICYEAIFPQLVRRLALAGAGLLVNISNDAWYGDSAAAAQHLEIARLRAVENGRFLLRATNDGITAIIDPYGRVLDQLPRHRALALPAHFDYLAGRTFYTAHGDVFAWLCLAVSVGMTTLGAVERGKPQAESKK